MADEHQVVNLRVEAFDPCLGVVVWSEGVPLLDIGAQQRTPHIGRLPCPRLA